MGGSFLLVSLGSVQTSHNSHVTMFPFRTLTRVFKLPLYRLWQAPKLQFRGNKKQSQGPKVDVKLNYQSAKPFCLSNGKMVRNITTVSLASKANLPSTYLKSSAGVAGANTVSYLQHDIVNKVSYLNRNLNKEKSFTTWDITIKWDLLKDDRSFLYSVSHLCAKLQTKQPIVNSRPFVTTALNSSFQQQVTHAQKMHFHFACIIFSCSVVKLPRLQPKDLSWSRQGHRGWWVGSAITWTRWERTALVTGAGEALTVKKATNWTVSHCGTYNYAR